MFRIAALLTAALLLSTAAKMLSAEPSEALELTVMEAAF
jgi:hypothetical protein